jgi:hypothetical protein
LMRLSLLNASLFLIPDHENLFLSSISWEWSGPPCQCQVHTTPSYRDTRLSASYRIYRFYR